MLKKGATNFKSMQVNLRKCGAWSSFLVGEPSKSFNSGSNELTFNENKDKNLIHILDIF